MTHEARQLQLMRDAIQARAIRRGTDWEYLSEADRRVLSATALEAGDNCWLDHTDELLPFIVEVLNASISRDNQAIHNSIYELKRAAITIAHHSGKWLYEDTWPRMDSEEFTDSSNAGKRLNEGDL